MKVSILICSRDRCESLRQTLESFRGLNLPDGIAVELVLADNGSTDDTLALMRGFKWDGVAVKTVSEARPGQVRARNAAVAASTGDVILFTDDDVRPPPDWIAGMSGPIVAGEADGVAGGIRMAPELEREWMTTVHRLWLAESPRDTTGSPDRMIGANMAFSRRALEKVPAFDPDLGPGQLGYGDDTLFSYQIKAAGMTIADRQYVIVEHHFGKDRLTRAKFEHAAANHGRTSAYIAHHWDHRTYILPELQALRKKLMLSLRSRNKGLEVSEGELHDIRSYHLYTHFAQISSEPRNYERHGLVKIGGIR